HGHFVSAPRALGLRLHAKSRIWICCRGTRSARYNFHPVATGDQVLADGRRESNTAGTAIGGNRHECGRRYAVDHELERSARVDADQMTQSNVYVGGDSAL